MGDTFRKPAVHDSDSESPAASPSNNAQGTSNKSGEATRAKRKKARRACAACQRAHLTCDDNRPCERCIKRGLQDDCHDGARKKAKYLQDAPDEALKPGAAAAYYQRQNSDIDTNAQAKALTSAPQSNASKALQMGDNGFVDTRPPSMHGFSSLPNNQPSVSSSRTFTSFGSPATQTANFQSQYSPAQANALPNMSGNFSSLLSNTNFDGSFSNPAMPSMMNFDPSSVNFGNQYGALEFGMLGHMASGANGLSRESSKFDGTSMGSSAYGVESNDLNNFGFGNGQRPIGEWQNHESRMNSWSSQHMGQTSDGRNEPNAYAIGNPPPNLIGASPGSSNADFITSFDTGSPTASLGSTMRRPASVQRENSQVKDQTGLPKIEPEHRPNKAVSKKLEQVPTSTATLLRRRNASKIYSSVIKPYPYTARFHALIALIARRFKSHKRLRIAKALASIRPSFISCTRTLIEEDLILMEKNFQRSLLEYRDHVSACGTPTIICRRTGEVAYSGESFVLLSGWPSAVLQGKEANLNTNTAGRTAAEDDIPSGTMTTSSRGGFTTPRVPNAASFPPPSAEPHPVFITDLLDDDSVIQFYEDFAKIAFADSKGSACRPCKLVKYRTKEDPANERLRYADSPLKGKKQLPQQGELLAREGRNDQQQHQQDISKLGEDDGTVDCMFCWTVKRDVFEFPMMIVINVSRNS